MSKIYCTKINIIARLCTIRSHGGELITLGRKLHTRTPKIGTRTSPARLSFVLKVTRWNLRPNIINFVPCDRILQRAFWYKNNRPFHDRSQGNQTCWAQVADAVGLPNQSQVKVDWYELLFFWIVQLASPHVWFCSVWLDRTRGLSLLKDLFTWCYSQRA